MRSIDIVTGTLAIAWNGSVAASVFGTATSDTPGKSVTGIEAVHRPYGNLCVKPTS